jgi:hypothetical protein
VTLPKAHARGRTIPVETGSLATVWHRAHNLVEARYAETRLYSHPDDAPAYARLRHVKGMWSGDIELAAFAADELDALKSLATTLTECGYEIDPMHLHTIEELDRIRSATPPAPTAAQVGDGLTANQRAARARRLQPGRDERLRLGLADVRDASDGVGK